MNVFNKMWSHRLGAVSPMLNFIDFDKRKKREFNLTIQRHSTNNPSPVPISDVPGNRERMEFRMFHRTLLRMQCDKWKRHMFTEVRQFVKQAATSQEKCGTKIVAGLEELLKLKAQYAKRDRKGFTMHQRVLLNMEPGYPEMRGPNVRQFSEKFDIPLWRHLCERFHESNATVWKTMCTGMYTIGPCRVGAHWDPSDRKKP